MRNLLQGVDIRLLDIDTWPTVHEALLDATEREHFLRRKRAIIAIVQGQSTSLASEVIYAPTRTGKTRLLMMGVERAKSVRGLRNNCFESIALSIDATDRLVLSEGGFWTWALEQVGHRQAQSRNGPAAKRHMTVEYFRGLANTIQSGRVVLFVDEAQHLQLVELGWFADLFNALERTGFKLVLFLVGSYHLQHWKRELQGKAHAHIRSRFFSQEFPLRGLANLDDFQRCLAQ